MRSIQKDAVILAKQLVVEDLPSKWMEQTTANTKEELILLHWMGKLVGY